MLKLMLASLVIMGLAAMVSAQDKLEKDTIRTSAGPLEITFIGHGTLMFSFQGRVVHVDPWIQLADYAKLPPADLILITHEHRDHLDLKALEILRQDHTVVVCSPSSAGQVAGCTLMENGATRVIAGLEIKAVPAYNVVHKRENGEPYHPKGNGNGYVITFGDKKVYVAGDTENVPEMKELKGIFTSFLPMNLPFTMTPEMAADAARSFRPKILYPYHFGETDPSRLVDLLRGEKGVEVRIRKMK